MFQREVHGLRRINFRIALPFAMREDAAKDEAMAVLHGKNCNGSFDGKICKSQEDLRKGYERQPQEGWSVKAQPVWISGLRRSSRPCIMQQSTRYNFWRDGKLAFQTTPTILQHVNLIYIPKKSDSKLGRLRSIVFGGWSSSIINDPIYRDKEHFKGDPTFGLWEFFLTNHWKLWRQL